MGIIMRIMVIAERGSVCDDDDDYDDCRDA